ncbi:MAG: tungstate ABC transporter substrate-binding protein WtpA [Bacteroidetes bacterium HGW-Bacteroidetes-1]|jgi:molybdate/tungstate transport system substrate-binding protein|nr:MAG: tungstate ABC transporter substrate-binding protein WtpA [Bacteroidetes bacterium HGW-Bacteroidetes-1]
MKRIFILLITVLALTNCSTKKPAEQIIIFHAGSMSYPLRSVLEGFKLENPEISILHEAAGSVASARKVTELKRPADILILADYQIIDQMLIPDFSSFNIHFATNSIGLAYTRDSRYSENINAVNWHEILQHPDVKTGVADPQADPCGYRTRMLLQLAEKIYSDSLLGQSILSEKKFYQRPKETDLIALLETRTIDYIFIYESISHQHGLEFLALSDSLNLSQNTLNNWYKNAEIKLRGEHKGDETTLKGEAITYGLTILNNAPNKKSAYKFVNWLLQSDKGILLLKNAGLKPLFPAQVHYEGTYPIDLKLNQ